MEKQVRRYQRFVPKIETQISKEEKKLMKKREEVFYENLVVNKP